MGTKWRKLLKMTHVSFFVMGFVGLLWVMALYQAYFNNLPRSPNPITGNVYPLNIHGIVVYQTMQERSRLGNWEHWSWGLAILGFVLGLIYQWRSGDL
jgi:hypothetical protein